MKKTPEEIAAQSVLLGLFGTIIFHEQSAILFPEENTTKQTIITEEGFTKINHSIMKTVITKHSMAMKFVEYGVDPILAFALVDKVSKILTKDDPDISDEDIEIHDCDTCKGANECPIKDKMMEIRSRRIMKDLLTNPQKN